MTLDKIKQNKTFELHNASNKLAGTINLSEVKIQKRTSFLDYVFGGCDISLAVAVDFTLSNGDPNDPQSLHFFDPKRNEYLQAI
jgi:hypothetical protein